MESTKLMVLVLAFVLLTMTASALALKRAPRANLDKEAVLSQRGESVMTLERAIGASPYYALCNDNSHGGGCAGTHTWCGPERDNYKAAREDMDAHKKANPSHDVTVYHVP